MANRSEKVWKNIESNWISLDNQNHCTQSDFKQGIEIEELKTTIKRPNQFYFSDKKFDNPSKGTLCYTVQGFGIIQEIRQGQQIYVVKLKNNDEIQEFKKKDVKFDLVIKVSVISNNQITSDSVVVPLNSSMNQLEKIINKSLNQDKGAEFQQILYQGKELKKFAQFELNTLGITEYSKFLAINPQGLLLFYFNHIQSQIKFYYQAYEKSFISIVMYIIAESDGWCYSNGSKDGIGFTVSKDLRFGGIGMYTTKEDTEFQVQLIEGKSNTDTVLAEKTFTLNKAEGKIVKCLFDKSVLLKADVSYVIIQTSLKNASGYYGQGGEKTLTTESGIIFNFCGCTGASNGTDFSRGQIPEIYYYA